MATVKRYKKIGGKMVQVDTKTGKALSSTSTKTPTTKTPTTKTSTTTTKTAPKIDYTFYAGKETPQEYNARIAAARGDTQAELDAMNTAVAKEAASGKVYNSSTVDATLARAQSMLDQTAAQGTTPYAGSTYEQQYLAKYPAPTNASLVDSQYTPTTIPTESPYISDIFAATSGMAGLDQMNQFQQKFFEQQLKAQEEQNARNQSLLEKFMGSVQSPLEARAQAIKETGIDPEKYYAQQAAGIKEIEALTNEYNNVVQMKDEQIARSQDKLGTNNFINNQVAQIERNAAPKLNRISADINAKAATLQALQGNFAEAQKYVNEAVAAATADTKFKYDMFTMVYNQNQDNFDRVQSIYKDAYTSAMAQAQFAYEQQLTDKRAMAELLLKYPTAGIDIYSDSLMDAYSKASKVAPTGSGESLTADMKNYNAAVATGYEGSFADFLGKGTSTQTSAFVDVMQAAINAGATPAEAAREAADVSEARGIPVDQATIDSWMTLASRLTPTPQNTSAPLYGSYVPGIYSTIPFQDNKTLDGVYSSLFSD